MDKAHVDRVNQELRAVGVTSYGLSKSEGRAIPGFIHEGEHIGGAVYGKIVGGGGDSAFLIATNSRIIFFDHKPMYSTFDELSYDVVAGVKMNKAAFAAYIELHTRVTDYKLKFVNPKCAKIFTEYIESRRLESGSKDMPSSPKTNPLPAVSLDKNGLEFLKQHDVAVLSTIDSEGNVYGSVIYYGIDPDNQIYIVTKSNTSKSRHILQNSRVALTVYDEDAAQTVQLSGLAVTESDKEKALGVITQLVKVRKYRDKADFPPVTKVRAGDYVVIKISPLEVKYRDFSQYSY